MRNKLVQTAAGIAIGAVLLNATPAFADWPTFDAITHYLIEQGTNFVTKSISNLQDKLENVGNLLADHITNLDTDISDVLTRGFTQNSNYQKAQIGAVAQIADASNAANFRVQRDIRNAELMSEHVTNPQQCLAIDDGQAQIAASVAANAVARSIGAITDNRGEALYGQPAYYGQAQAVQAINQLHMSRYCSQAEEDASLCTGTALGNADQHAWNLFGTGNLTDQTGIDTANDYATNLLQPIVPASLRGNQLTSLTGQDAWARRRSYNARMSLGRNLLNYVIAIQAPVVTLTDGQKKQLTNEGLPTTDQGSWLQAVTLEVDRRFSGLDWAAALQSMPPATVQREIATEIALSNYLALQNYRVGLWQATISAVQMAQIEETKFQTMTLMPSPDMASR